MTSCRRVIFAFCAVLLLAVPAFASLTIETITWNIIGLDSNDPLSGPQHFPVGARVCSDVATTNVGVDYFWDSANPNVDLRSGSLSSIILSSISAGGCADAYFEVEVNQVPAAYDTTREYHITATDMSGTVSTPTPRELLVEHLISQNRNAITDVKYGPNPLSLTSVPPGGSMALVVGNTYTIQLLGGTATQGYNQFEAFINFTNTIFQILSVETTYSANNSPYVTGPAPAIHDQLYADACLWENDPNSPNYRACVGGDFKSGGSTVVTTYTIQIIGGGGTSQTLTTLLYDFSGSSFHYNADFGTGARIAEIIDPSTATISKSFSPNPAVLNGVSVLTFTLSNPNGAPLSGFNFVDNLPANLEVAATPGVTTSGCGSPTVTANAGSTSISFANGTVGANGACTVSVNITPIATGAFLNTTNNLFVGTTDTGDNASDTLNVNTETPGTGICGSTLAAWTFPTGFTLASPAPSTLNVASGSANPGPGLSNPTISSTNSTTTADGTISWGSNGEITTGAALVTANDDYYQFAFDTTGVTSVTLNFDALKKTPNGPAGIAVFYGTTTKAAAASEPAASIFDNSNALPTQNTWATFGPINVNTGLNPSGLTYFRIYVYNSGNTNSGSDSNIDNVVFTGCTAGTKPTLTKSFSPDPIAVNGVSTLTFTLANTNTTALTNAAFSDVLPAGLEVAATPNASTTGCGAPTWAPIAGSTTLAFSNGTIPASGSCTVSVDITATTAGGHPNVAGFLSTTETGQSTDSVATDTLTAVLPPVIDKNFSPDPIIPNGISTLTFIITNPNVDQALSGVAFGDTFPIIPAAMVVATTPNASTSGCGAPTFSPSAGAGSVSFSGGTIAGGGTCIVQVDVTAPAAGAYENLTDPVSHIINAETIDGNAASDTLDVNAPNPSIHMLKQAGPTANGPWTSYLAVATGADVFYRFTIENTGDVPLSPVSISDNMVDVSVCNAGFPATLQVADAFDDDHLATCIVGPVTAVSGVNPNTAIATGTFSGNPVQSNESEAFYATTEITLDKTAVQASFTNAGDTINYNYLVTNSGFATLSGPVTVTDDKATVTCPALTTVGDFDNFFDPGESVTCTASYIITPGDVAAGFVTNTAHASAGGVDSANDSVTILSTTSANISVTKTLDSNGPFTAGMPVTYTITVANAGPSTANNIQVTDTPTNLTITNVSGACVSLPCTIASLANGGNAVITVTATINAAGAFDNAVTVDADEPDPDTSDNTDNDGDTATASANVSIVKTLVTAGPYVVGQSISYTLTIANAGPSTATNIQVTDTPTNLSITSVSGACASLPCMIASLASGANTVINVTATINAVGTFDNVAAANGDEPDPDSSDNTDDTTNGGTAGPSADVSIVKTLTTAGPYIAGQSITFTLDIANAGPSIANNIQVTDAPTNLTITNVSGACATLPCTIASLGVGANTSITVTATINGAGAFDNVASVDADEPDPDTSDNTDNDGSSTGTSANVSIVKTLVTTGPYVVGQSLSYTLTIANAGPSTATNIDVTDTPTNLTITNVSGACASLPCTIASLASAANTIINVTATINAVGAFDNVATANADEPDPDSSDNTDDTTNGGTAGPSADVSIVKTLTTAAPYSVGQSISYTLQVANAGPSTATNIQVTDTPTNLSITSVSGACASLPCTIASLASGANTVINVTATIVAEGAFDNVATANADEPDPDSSDNTDNTGNNGSTTPSANVSIAKTLVTAGPYSVGQSISYTLTIANAGPSAANNIDVTDTPSNLTITNVSGACASLPCTIASLASGANTSINITATIDAVGAFDNVATANADEPDPDTSDNTDDDGNNGFTGASADLSIVKTLTTAPPYSLGQTITYTLQISNDGPSTATNIQVTDTPANLTITGVSGSGCASLPCTIPSLAASANTTINVTATINAGGAFDNVATVSADEPDPDPDDNTDADGNGGTAPDVDLAITKTSSSPEVEVGENFTYTLVVVNNGPDTATGVVVTDPLPANFQLASATSTQGSCTGTTTVTCTIGTMLDNATVTITITGHATAVGVLMNTATVDANETEAVTSNNESSAGPLASHVPGHNIPTASEWGLLMLALMLGVLAITKMR